jgi:hypothetical protein
VSLLLYPAFNVLASLLAWFVADLFSQFAMREHELDFEVAM